MIAWWRAAARAVADRGEPWFDYRSFAESLGPDDPVRFSWSRARADHRPRDGNEVMRSSLGQPLYWKARNLDVFDGVALDDRAEPPTFRRATSRGGRPARGTWRARGVDEHDLGQHPPHAHRK